ncbi:hypothetical protein C0V77_06720 [Emticicia sp. TH156]|nr:hypothetical protein C0V77_06720 [Emticicia sp. TH156]
MKYFANEKSTLTIVRSNEQGLRVVTNPFIATEESIDRMVLIKWDHFQSQDYEIISYFVLIFCIFVKHLNNLLVHDGSIQP